MTILLTANFFSIKSCNSLAFPFLHLTFVFLLSLLHTMLHIHLFFYRSLCHYLDTLTVVRICDMIFTQFFKWIYISLTYPLLLSILILILDNPGNNLQYYSFIWLSINNLEQIDKLQFLAAAANSSNPPVKFERRGLVLSD